MKKKESYKVLLADDEQIERMALARRLLKRFGENLVFCRLWTERKQLNSVRRNGARL